MAKWVFASQQAKKPLLLIANLNRRDVMKRPTAGAPTVAIEHIASHIYLIRDEKVMLDSDLAKLYRVETGALTRAMKRNRERFPKDFCFQLTQQEFENLKCQVGISSLWGGRRHPPWAFTEQGVAMLSGVLRSRTAVQANIEIMRAFVRLRGFLTDQKDLAAKLAEMEQKYDAQFAAVFEAIRELMAPRVPARRRIGFAARKSD